MCIACARKIEYKKPYGWKVLRKVAKNTYETLWLPEGNIKNSAVSTSKASKGYGFGFFKTRKEARLYKKLFMEQVESYRSSNGPLVICKIVPHEVYEGMSDTSFGWRLFYSEMVCCQSFEIIEEAK